MSAIQQRDAFFERVYERARDDHDVMIVAADMAAPALDEFRLRIPHQFVNVGIAEQNAVLIASGLALNGKKPIVYAIAPFVTARCLEQIRVQNSIMHIPITIAGMSMGFGYDTDGPTHQLLEDIAYLRVLPNIDIHSVTDHVMARHAADYALDSSNSVFVRLDKNATAAVYDDQSDFSAGVARLREGSDAVIVTTGCMVHQALTVADDLAARGLQVGVVDVYRFPISPGAFHNALGGCGKIVSLEEHFLPGGLGATLCEMTCDHEWNLRILRMGVPTEMGWVYKYGGREAIREHYGLDRAAVAKAVENMARRN